MSKIELVRAAMVEAMKAKDRTGRILCPCFYLL